MKNIFKILSFIVFLVFLLTFFLRSVEMEDIWWHIKTGEWMMQNHQVPYFDPFSPVNPPSEWITNQWLGSCFFNIVEKISGVYGLSIFRSMFFTLIVLLIFFHFRRRKVDHYLLITIGLLAALAFDNRAILRPFIFNLIFIHIFLIQLFQHERDKKHWRLFLLSGLGIIWANIHLGSFVYGMILLGTYFLGMTLSLSKTSDPTIRKEITRNCFLILSSIILFLLSLCITPYGFSGIWHDIRVFIDPNYINFYKLSNSINEMKPPGYILSFSGIWFYVLLGLSFSALRRGKAFFWRWILWLSVLFLFLYSKRGADFFGIVTAHLILDHFAEQPIDNNKHKIFLKTAALVAIGFMISQCRTSLSQYAVIHKEAIPLYAIVQTPMSPMNLINQIKDSRINGNIFCPDFWGGYFLWAAYPRFIPIIDGRQANQTVFKDYIYAMSKPDEYWDGFSQKYNLHLAFVDMYDSNYHPLVRYLMSSKKWRLIDVQGSTILLSDELESKKYSLESTLNKNDVYILEKLSRRSLDRSFLQNFIHPPPFYIDFMVESSILYDLGFRKAAVKRLDNLEGISDTGIISEVSHMAKTILSAYNSETSK